MLQLSFFLSILKLKFVRFLYLFNWDKTCRLLDILKRASFKVAHLVSSFIRSVSSLNVTSWDAMRKQSLLWKWMRKCCFFSLFAGQLGIWVPPFYRLCVSSTVVHNFLWHLFYFFYFLILWFYLLKLCIETLKSLFNNESRLFPVKWDILFK